MSHSETIYGRMLLKEPSDTQTQISTTFRKRYILQGKRNTARVEQRKGSPSVWSVLAVGWSTSTYPRPHFSTWGKASRITLALDSLQIGQSAAACHVSRETIHACRLRKPRSTLIPPSIPSRRVKYNAQSRSRRHPKKLTTKQVQLVWNDSYKMKA